MQYADSHWPLRIVLEELFFLIVVNRVSPVVTLHRWKYGRFFLEYAGDSDVGPKSDVLN